MGVASCEGVIHDGQVPLPDDVRPPQDTVVCVVVHHTEHGSTRYGRSARITRHSPLATHPRHNLKPRSRAAATAWRNSMPETGRSIRGWR